MDAISSLPLSFAAVGLGLVMLVGGGELLVAGAARLARRLGMSPLLIGLTVVAFGTSLPELFVCLTAGLAGHDAVMVGNVVGSNIANIGLVLGTCALFAPLRLTVVQVLMEVRLLTWGGLALLACAVAGAFPRALGLAFVVVLVSYTIWACRHEGHRLDHGDGEAPPPAPLPLALVMVAAGLVLLGVGSRFFISGATSLARHFGISELVIGLTLAAVGTSLPELASSLSAVRRGQGEMLVGNVIGSNFFNLFMVMGLTAAVHPFAMETEVLLRDLPAMLAFFFFLVLCLRVNGQLSRPQGLILLTAYAGYIVTLM